MQIWAKESGDNYTCFHLVSNLSVGGLLIEKKLPFAIGSVLKLELEIPDPEENIHLKGRVVNRYDGADETISGTGLKFIEMKEEDRKKIESLLDRIK